MEEIVDKSVQEFVPNENMKKVLEAYCDMDTKPTISARMDHANVSRTMWYEWIQIPGFQEWWNTETDKFMESVVGELKKIGYMKSASDFRYWEAMMMKFGDYARKGEDKIIIKDQDKIDSLLKKYVTNKSEGQETTDTGTTTNQ